MQWDDKKFQITLNVPCKWNKFDCAWVVTIMGKTKNGIDIETLLKSSAREREFKSNWPLIPKSRKWSSETGRSEHEECERDNQRKRKERGIVFCFNVLVIVIKESSPFILDEGEMWKCTSRLMRKWILFYLFLLIFSCLLVIGVWNKNGLFVSTKE